MTDRRWHALSWYQALTLAERSASLSPGGEGATHADFGEQRIKCWRAQAGLTSDALFAHRLAADGLNEEVFGHLLAEPIEAVRARVATPAWLADYAAAFARKPSAGPIPLPER